MHSQERVARTPLSVRARQRFSSAEAAFDRFAQTLTPSSRAMLFGASRGTAAAKLMARGWESKSVEEQIELAATRPERGPAPARLTEEERRLRRERESLELSRTRVMRELAAASHPRRREMLEATLKHLNEKLSNLQGMSPQQRP